MGFKIGEIVRFTDGDGRPHRIVDIKAHGPLNSKERETYYLVRRTLFSDAFRKKYFKT